MQFCQPIETTARELARVLKNGARFASLTHDWSLKKYAGSVEEWAKATTAAFEANGFWNVECFRAKAEKGRAVALVASRL